MEPKQTHKAEVAHHLIDGVTSEFSGDGIGISSGGVDLQLLVDVALVHHGVKNVEDLHRGPML